TCGTSPDGVPIELFLQDPPIVIDKEEMQLPDRHPIVVERWDEPGVYDIWDIVGKKFYPDIAAFIEEARRLGVSRRCELKDYSILTKESKLVILHPKGWIENHAEYYSRFSIGEALNFVCPKKWDKWPDITPHEVGDEEMCARLWWHDVKQPKREKGEEDKPKD